MARCAELVSMLNTLDTFTGAYGQTWDTGITTDHVHAATEAGCLLHTTPKGWARMTGPRGGASVPVLCGEVVGIDTEDGIVSGRCGQPVKANAAYGTDLGCPGHHEMILGYHGRNDHYYA